jgi:hypothetical protein
MSPEASIAVASCSSKRSLPPRSDAELTGRSRLLESNAPNWLGDDFEYKSHRITSKLDVEGSSPFSRSTGPSLGLHELEMALSHGLSMSSSDRSAPLNIGVVLVSSKRAETSCAKIVSPGLEGAKARRGPGAAQCLRFRLGDAARPGR